MCNTGWETDREESTTSIEQYSNLVETAWSWCTPTFTGRKRTLGFHCWGYHGKIPGNIVKVVGIPGGYGNI